MGHDRVSLESIALDDELYARHICSDKGLSMIDHDEVSLISIPRGSFTAFRLSYASPVEVSLSSKSLLLGGVPHLWYVQHKNNILRSLYEFTFKSAARRVQMASKYANSMRSPSRRKARRAKKVTAQDEWLNQELFLRQTNIAEGSQAPQVGFNSWQDAHSKGHSKSSQSRTSTDFNDSIALGVLQEGHEHRYSSNSRDSDAYSDSLSGLYCDQALLKETKRPQDHERESCKDSAFGSKTSMELNHNGSEKALGINLELSTREAEMNHQKADGGCVMSSSENHDKIPQTFQEYSQHISHSDINCSPVSANSKGLVKFKVDKRPKRHSNSLLLHQDTSNDELGLSGGASSSDEDDSVIDLRLKTSEKNKLKLLSPEPYNLTRQQLQDFSNIETHQRGFADIRNLANTAGKKMRLEKLESKLLSDVGRGLGADLTRFFRKYRAGEIVKMEKMIVFVKASTSAKGTLSEFSEVEPIDTRVVDRWKEYILVARTTGDPKAPLYLQFYKDQNIPEVEQHTGPQERFRANSMDFMLDVSCMVGFYNTLDKTIHVIKRISPTVDGNKGFLGNDPENPEKLRIYLLKCCSTASAENWLLFFQRSLGLFSLPKRVTINIPEAPATLDIPLPTELRDHLDKRTYVEEEELKLLNLPRGYKPISFPLTRYLELIIVNKLLQSGYVKSISKWAHANIITGLCWKHYDRLEWCSRDQYELTVGGMALRNSHSLEFRSVIHYPRSVKLNSGETLTEPCGVEGFLMKCTDRYGRETENIFHTAYYRFLYFFSSDGLLFFMNSFKGLPPLPDHFLSKSENCSYDIGEVEKEMINIPKAYEHNPYPLDLNNHIQWLEENMNPKDFEEKDNVALTAMWRKIAHIIKADKVIDLTEVVSVCKLKPVKEQKNTLRFKILARANNFVWKTSRSVDDTINSIFTLSMSNGLHVRLLAPSPEVADIWVSKLSSLSVYWKHRKAEDTRSMWSAKVENLNYLKMPESEESNISENTPKWVTDRGVANDEIHNASAQAIMRPIISNGVLYQKNHKHSTFKKFFVILTPGYLILYQYFKSGKINYSKKVCDHRHHVTIPIEECYVYSGNLTSLDLLERDKQFDYLNPGKKPLPRVYSDGWRSSESEGTRCFTLWFGTKRAVSNYSFLFSQSSNTRWRTASSTDTLGATSPKADCAKSKKRTSETGELSMEDDLKKNPGFIHLATRLGVSGRALVFMARSRQERDQWVLRIHSELERLRNGPEY
ncbi:LADA_0F03752g1_1 [Lachancea dasiensis]|uniref:LADA_0F03752g1_1 n=1 Tax=Lachancea dasiensis TaxID=1072105 RepID=A0A1G4JJ09_9SACH|nr:LADA_0F03752g1_1 [Lachancea dasiensis]